MSLPNKQITISNATVHNLKGVSCVIPHGTLCCLTGVSGSGKSSLAFDTIFVEGQRRYVQSLSHQAKRIIGSLPKPEVEAIEGLTPTIAIEQKRAGGSPRSTVGTLTEIYDYLRVLYARLATPYCPISHEPLTSISRQEIIDTILNRYVGRSILMLAPAVRQKKGELKDDLQALERKGYSRVRLDGLITRISDIESVDKSSSHTMDVVVDRLKIIEENRKRIIESASNALEIGHGVVIIVDAESEDEELFSENAYSKASGTSYPPLEPSDFTFNSPSGMCEECQGLGERYEFILNKIIDETKSIAEDCCSIAGSYKTVMNRNIFDNLASLYNFSVHTPWSKLSEKAQQVLLNGTDRRWVRMVFINPNTGATWTDNVQWKGILYEAKKKYQNAKSERYKRQMEEYMHLSICHACHGSRLKPYPAASRLNGLTIHELTEKSIDEVALFFQNFVLSPRFSYAEEAISQVRSRLSFLQKVGLGYLSLGRPTTTLSGGEFQRVRLASQIGSCLAGITYVLDEPSIGLHPEDNERLIESLLELKKRGNTVIVVEHDEQMMRASDWIIDFGKGAGVCGGEILHQGTVSDLESVPSSLTSDYLFNRRTIAKQENVRGTSKKKLILQGVSHRNLHNVDLEIPLERFIAVTGVSGSGKSSLIFETLYPSLSNRLMGTDRECGPFVALKGTNQIDKVVHIDQTPIGRTSRSNPATYSGVFDDIRALYASLPESKARGWSPGRFSFNVKHGVCPTCTGMGVVPLNMDFLETAFVCCTACEGRRFDNETLSVQYKGKSILDILNMTCTEACDFFSAIPTIRTQLETLCRVGLDYIQLGQPAPTLSGGEAQRLKIAEELSRPSTGRTLYLLDEPTTGLHFHDLCRLLDVLHELVTRGNTVLVIEHNMDLVKTADWIIDMGPGAGEAGGQIIAAGTPQEIACLTSPTGRALKRVFSPPPLPPSRKGFRKEQSKNQITICGAQQNNLKNLSLTLPKDKLIAVIGPSGVGKSSLAFETLFAEGQRHYVESLTPYARQYIKQMRRASVDAISNLPPTVAITQREHATNPRSTVGTITEIYDYLRILWSRLGIPHCPKTGAVIREMSCERVCDLILKESSEQPLFILAPCQGVTAQNVLLHVETCKRYGYSRIRINGQVIDITTDDLPRLKAGRKVRMEIIVDRLRPSEEERSRLIASIEEAARLGGNQLITLCGKKERLFNLAFAVAETGESFPEITAQTFAFNSPLGRCPDCFGLGVLTYGDFSALDNPAFEAMYQFYDWDDLLKNPLCPSCKGARLHPLARHVTINSTSISDLCHMSVREARQWLSTSLDTALLEKPLQRVVGEIDTRLHLIEQLGIGYLALDRAAATLSGGEAQRVRLISQIGSNLSGLMYVLDEPTCGLHPHDIAHLKSMLDHLKSLKNTILVVEHDPQLIKEADHIIELGDGGGECGGKIVFEGSYEAFRKSKKSPTAESFHRPLSLNDGSSLSSSSSSIAIHSASCHNLIDFSCSLPTEGLIGIVGVSGSGKSTLLFDVIYPAIQGELGDRRYKNSKISGLDGFERCVTIDQQPLGRTPRSDLSTYFDVSTLLRTHYASLPGAQALGLLPAHFSTFHHRGMCKQCAGMGTIKIDLHFLPSVRVPCEACHGLRLNPKSLSVEYKGKNFGQMLQCTVEEARDLFEDHWKISRLLDTLIAVGLPYLQLGQETIALSRGEAQRVRLAKELAKPRKGVTLYLMDEPMTGLHMNEVALVLRQLRNLTNEGHTVLMIEHTIEAIASCDFLLELGPGAGPEGGKVIAHGSPQHIARLKKTPTGRFLQMRNQ